jgi:hypothetical protein
MPVREAVPEKGMDSLPFEGIIISVSQWAA